MHYFNGSITLFYDNDDDDDDEDRNGDDLPTGDDDALQKKCKKKFEKVLSRIKVN